MSTLNSYTVSRPLQAVDGGLLTLTSPTTLLGADLDDDSSASTAIGFTFPIDGLTATAFVANTNGWALLTGTAPSPVYSNAMLGDASGGSLVAPWWDDMRTATVGGYVKTELLGSSPNRVRVIEWKCYGAYGQTSSNNDTLTFQACLYESGKVEFRYAPVVTTGTPTRAAYSASVGVRGDCSSTVNNHIRDFFGTAGSPVGSSTPVTTTLKAAGAVSHYPADSAHTGIPVGAYNIHLDPVAAVVRPRILSTSYSPGSSSGSYVATNTLNVDVGAGSVVVRSSAPLNFEDLLADLTTAADTAVPAGAPWSFRYDATTQRVTVESGASANFSYSQLGNLFNYLGMNPTASGARTYSGWRAPAGVLECLSLEVDPPLDASRVDLAQYRHGRSIATVWGSAMTFRCRAWISAAQRDTWQAGYVTTGLVRVYQAGGSTSPYSATNLGGYIEGYVVGTSDLQVYGQNEGVLSWSFLLSKARE